jgi:hypothetical protein
MNWIWLVLLVLSPGIVYVLAMFAVAIGSMYFPRRCPRCGQRGLIRVNSALATIIIDGKRTPDSWSYERCQKCNAHLKRHRSQWLDVQDAEWEAECGAVGPMASDG